MSLNLLKIGQIDYTNNILEGSFEVSKKDVVDSWTDANRVERRNIVRTRIEGQFKMKFLSLDAYNDFIANMVASKQREGFYPCEIRCNNTQTVEPADLFIDFDTALRQNGSLQLTYEEFSVNVMER